MAHSIYRVNERCRPRRGMDEQRREVLYRAAMRVARMGDHEFRLTSPEDVTISKVIFLDSAGRNSSAYIAILPAESPTVKRHE